MNALTTIIGKFNPNFGSRESYFPFEKIRKLFDVLDITFVLRSMLFSMPVHVVAFASIGVSAKQIVYLEGVFLLGLEQLAKAIVSVL